MTRDTRYRWPQDALAPRRLTAQTSPFLLAGADISFDKHSSAACACVVLMRLPDLRVVHESLLPVTMTLPYISGYLAFREAGPLAAAYRQAVREYGTPADVVVVDGNGYLHVRHFGLACHLGVLLDTPTIGVSKKYYR